MVAGLTVVAAAVVEAGVLGAGGAGTSLSRAPCFAGAVLAAGAARFLLLAVLLAGAGRGLAVARRVVCGSAGGAGSWMVSNCCWLRLSKRLS